MVRSKKKPSGRAPALARYDDETALALRLVVILDRTYAALREHRWRHIEANGLTPTEFGILEALLHKGPLTLGQIGGKVLLTSGGLTYVSDNIVRRGLVRRRRSEDDRRVIYLELTEQGHATIAALFPEHAEVIRRATEGLTSAEKRTAIRLLKKLGYAAAERAARAD